MTITKTRLGDLFMPYSVAILPRPDGLHYLAATELHGEWHHYAPPDYKPRVASHAPGGVLTFAPFPDNSGRLLAIENAFPIYHFGDSTITLASPPQDSATTLWQKRPLAKIPNLHRIALFTTGSSTHLIASTMFSGKKHQNDWASPGAVLAAGFDLATGTLTTPFATILPKLSRNHGLTIAPLNGTPTLLVSGIEGLFALTPPTGTSTTWQTAQLLSTDTSDSTLFDLDNDGIDELVTIEPFHGNTLNIYRQTSSGLQLVQQHPASFGHVLWTGLIQNRRCLITGNRSGPKDLRLLAFHGNSTLAHDIIPIDADIGPATLAIHQTPDKTSILSANHTAHEVSLYEIT